MFASRHRQIGKWACIRLQGSLCPERKAYGRPTGMALEHVQESRQLIPNFRMIGQSDVHTLDGLSLDLGQRLDFAASNLRSLIATIDGSGNPNQPFRSNQMACRLKQVGKDYHLNSALKILQAKVRHTVAFLGQHELDGSDDA